MQRTVGGRCGILMVCLAITVSVMAQRPMYGKMSTFVRSLVMQTAHNAADATTRADLLANKADDDWLCAFVRFTDNNPTLADQYGITLLAQIGDVSIVRIPIASLGALSREPSVVRIEANRTCRVAMDTMAVCLRADKAYEGNKLPQAYTGKGVVVGVQDIGFDLTHPTFSNSAGTQYRIKALWDQLAPQAETASDNVPVGVVYEGEGALKSLAHSYDGNDCTHGTHTTGIAAGSGFNAAYRGVAYESDICLVANATGDNMQFIPEKDIPKYTYATDLLGFKYIFDYAEQQGKPCVISFSEGSGQDFRGDDQLYYEALANLVGPGRIFVAAAGNDGAKKTYFAKPVGIVSAGTCIKAVGQTVLFTLKGSSHFVMNLKPFAFSNTASCEFSTSAICALADSTLTQQEAWGTVTVHVYPSCYQQDELVADIRVSNLASGAIAVEATGTDTMVEFYLLTGEIYADERCPELRAGEALCSILSPGSAPAAICVGASSYRTDIYTYSGEHRVYNQGTHGQRGFYSSVGPTFDGRIKPDVLAPGTNVISAYSSYYIENHPDAWDVQHSDKQLFDYQGRTYAWYYDSGTSMSTPAVAGAIALWLEANPRLTPNEVRTLLDKTCYRHDATLTYPNNLYGYGQIDVYRGLLEILGLTAVNDISTHTPANVTIRPQGNNILIRFCAPPSRPFSVRVYTSHGQLCCSRQMPAGQEHYCLALPEAQAGVYAVQVLTGEEATTGSQLVRLP